MDYAIQTLNANAVLCNNLFISLWSCHLFYFGDVVVYVYICYAVVVYNLLFDMSLHFGAQWILEWMDIFVSSMRWEGGLIAYFDLPCPFNFSEYGCSTTYISECATAYCISAGNSMWVCKAPQRAHHSIGRHWRRHSYCRWISDVLSAYEWRCCSILTWTPLVSTCTINTDWAYASWLMSLYLWDSWMQRVLLRYNATRPTSMLIPRLVLICLNRHLWPNLCWSWTGIRSSGKSYWAK